MNSIHEQCPNSGLNSVQVTTPVQVATSHWPTQVATPRDVATSFLLPSLKPGRDTKTRSRLPGDFTYVATSFPCRDLTHCRSCRDIDLCRDFNSQQARLRRQFHVATSWRLTYVATSTPCRDLSYCRPCRDLKMMSRHQLPLSPISAMSRRHVATSLAATHVATSNMMSRHPIRPAASQPGCDVHFLVVTSRPTTPGRDLIMMSRPQTGPNL